MFEPQPAGLDSRTADVRTTELSAADGGVVQLPAAQGHPAELTAASGRTPDVRMGPADIRTAGIVGAGTMGVGIAMAFANAGIAVRLIDASPEALERAGSSIAAAYAAGVERGRFTRDGADERLASIRRGVGFENLAGVDIAVEAVFEDLAIKRDVFARLGASCGEETLLATNTSTLDVDAIAIAAPHPERSLGLHFFSPAHVMKLVEIVRGVRTSPATVAKAERLVARLGKVPVVVGNRDGFVGNRMLLGYKREAEYMLLAGATPERIDAALRDFGFAMGIFAVSDLAGIDVGWRSKQERIKRGLAPAYTVTGLPDALVAAGRLGQKSGRGYFRYEPGSRAPQPDSELEPLIVAERERLAVREEYVCDREIVERCVFALVNEGAKIVEEGVASCAGDIDTIWVNGYGFPKALGGPMRFAESIGLDRVLQAIRTFAQRDAKFWRTSSLLVDAARRGTFA